MVGVSLTDVIRVPPCNLEHHSPITPRVDVKFHKVRRFTIISQPFVELHYLFTALLLGRAFQLRNLILPKIRECHQSGILGMLPDRQVPTHLFPTIIVHEPIRINGRQP